MPATNGAPQVSILGPVLFNLSINVLDEGVDAVMNQFNHRGIKTTNFVSKTERTLKV